MKLHEIREATQNDEVLTKVCDAITNNWWRFYKSDIHMKGYDVLRKELNFHDDVIIRKQKLIIPHCLRHSILTLAQEGHISIVKCKARLRSKFQWPYRFWSLAFYFGMSLVLNHIASSPTSSNNANSNSRITVAISSYRFIWSISNWRNFTILDFQSMRF